MRPILSARALARRWKRMRQKTMLHSTMKLARL
jgi:hypothetical protein